MAKVLCTLPHASDLINGVKFVEHKLGMLSEEISDEAAALFLSIEGYVIPGKKAATKDADPATPPADAKPAPDGKTDADPQTPPAA